MNEFPIAKETVEDDGGKTPLIAAILLGRVALVERMLNIGFSPHVFTEISSPIGAAISSAHPYADTILQILLNKYGSLSDNYPCDDCGELNEPMLHGAIRRRKARAVEILMQYGAQLDWVDSDGVSGYELACEVGLELDVGEA